MKLNKLKEFLSVADALSDEVKDRLVLMMSTSLPTFSNCGCHAGLVSIIAKDLPELQEIYNNHDYYDTGSYRYENWADALAVFIGFCGELDLEAWAGYYPKLWGNKNGAVMFSSSIAFKKYGVKKLTHRDIINHWHKVALNIENGVKA